MVTTFAQAFFGTLDSGALPFSSHDAISMQSHHIMDIEVGDREYWFSICLVMGRELVVQVLYAMLVKSEQRALMCQ
jgi:hypothetical protein